MTHNELLAELTDIEPVYARATLYSALRAVVELHKCSNPRFDLLCDCGQPYPCLTIQEIEKELK